MDHNDWQEEGLSTDYYNNPLHIINTDKWLCDTSMVLEWREAILKRIPYEHHLEIIKNNT